MSDPPSPASGDVRNFFATALIAIGWLVLLLSGLCTSVVLLIGVPMLLSGPNSFLDSLESLLAGLLYPLVIGGIPMAIGVGLIAAGRAVRRAGAPPPAAPGPEAGV